MLVATRGALQGTVISEYREYIIVPIFFRKQLETNVEKSNFDASLSLIFGDETENYRIVKSIRSVPFEILTSTAATEKSIDEIIDTSKQQFIGYVYSGKNFSRRELPIPNHHEGSVSFIQLKVLNGITQDWNSWISKDLNQTVEKQKVIL